MTTISTTRQQMAIHDAHIMEWEQERPARRLDPNEYIVSWSARLGWRAFGAVLFGQLVPILESLGGIAFDFLSCLSLAAAAGFSVSFVGMIYARWQFDRANVEWERLRGVPNEDDEVREIDRSLYGQQAEPVRIYSDKIGTFQLTAREVTALKTIDNPNREAVKDAIGKVRNDNYGEFCAAMVRAGHWEGNSATGYSWTAAGDEWRKS